MKTILPLIPIIILVILRFTHIITADQQYMSILFVMLLYMLMCIFLNHRISKTLEKMIKKIDKY